MLQPDNAAVQLPVVHGRSCLRRVSLATETGFALKMAIDSALAAQLMQNWIAIAAH